jgi:hypothetical protein
MKPSMIIFYTQNSKPRGSIRPLNKHFVRRNTITLFHLLTLNKWVSAQEDELLGCQAISNSSIVVEYYLM